MKNLTILFVYLILISANILYANCLPPATAIAAGMHHSLALAEDGTVWAWGCNNNGQLGNNSSTPSQVPIQVFSSTTSNNPLTNIIGIAAGLSHSLALSNDSTVWAWGHNNDGQLGNNSTTNSFVPVQVVSSALSLKPLTNIVAIAAGGFYSLGLSYDGTVWAWGYNNAGQLGNNSTLTSLTPVQVVASASSDPLTNIVAISAGPNHPLALDTNGMIWAWGNNQLSKLGNGSHTKSLTAVCVLDPRSSNPITNMIAIAAGDYHSLAVAEDGTIWSWGNNNVGQLGNGSISPSALPSHFTLSSDPSTQIIAVKAGLSYSLALAKNGTGFAWGFNLVGELGNNSTATSSRPVRIVASTISDDPLSHIVDLAAGGLHSLALTSDGTVWTWGNNEFGQLGNHSNVSSPIPIQISSGTTNFLWYKLKNYLLD